MTRSPHRWTSLSEQARQVVPALPDAYDECRTCHLIRYLGTDSPQYALVKGQRLVALRASGDQGNRPFPLEPTCDPERAVQMDGAGLRERRRD